MISVDFIAYVPEVEPRVSIKTAILGKQTRTAIRLDAAAGAALCLGLGLLLISP